MAPTVLVLGTGVGGIGDGGVGVFVGIKTVMGDTEIIEEPGAFVASKYRFVTPPETSHSYVVYVMLSLTRTFRYVRHSVETPSLLCSVRSYYMEQVICDSVKERARVAYQVSVEMLATVFDTLLSGTHQVCT